VSVVRVARIDVGALDRFERTPSGGLRIPAFLTRVGVLTYRTPDGETVRELRPREEVLDAASIATLEDAPVTDLHPPGLVKPETWKEYAVGSVRGARADGDRVAGDLLVLDADEIRRVEAGERVEVSCGYTCDLDRTPGVFEGEHYDAVQRRIRYNHAGLGPRGWGRAGPEVALRLDGTQLDAAYEVTMSTTRVRVDGIEYDAGSDSHLQAIERSFERRDAALATAQSERDEARGRADTLSTRLAAAERERDEHKARADAASSSGELDKRVQARLALLDRARRVLGADFDGAGQTDREIMAAVLDEAGASVADDASDDYVRGAFDAATASPAEPTGEGEDRADGRGSRVKLAPGGELPPEGKDRTRADNAKWEAEAPSRFAMRKG